jgi:hypothetical protein
MNKGFRWADRAVRSGDVDSLARTPEIVRETLGLRLDAWLDARHISDGFSPREALGHMIHAEDENWIPRIRHILELGEGEPFKPFDVLGGNLMSHETGMPELIEAFADRRHASLEQLARLSITTDDLGKTGLHPAFGRVTLDQLLSTWVAHDLYHLGQIFKSFSAPFREAIGPWQEFLNLPNFN